MTWYAHEVLCVASPEALAYVHAEPRLLPHTYVVRPPLQHDWFSEEARHDLPPQGLLVVQPAVSAKQAGEWYESGVLDWDTLEADETELRITPQQVCSHQPDASLDDFPPAKALAYLKAMSTQIHAPVVYYGCTMWGGSVELEYAWVFHEDDQVLIRTPAWAADESATQLMQLPASGSVTTAEGDVLRGALRSLGLALPTRYFALHTRGFPWPRHKLSSHGS